MAEVVQRNLEARLNELDELERKGLFSREEIRTIVRKRRNFEYSINKRIVQKEDFLRYIQYEISLDMLRKKRKKRAQFVGPKSTIDYSIVQHVHQLFQLATNRFKGDLKLWLQYAQYCERVGSHRQLSQVYGHALQYHPHNAGLWISAAKTEFEVNKNVVAARNVLLKALRNNPDMKQLWHEYFRLELLYVDKLFKRRQVLGVQSSETDPEEVSDAILQYKAASIVFHQATEAITGDVQFCLQFLLICRLFERTEKLQDEIYTCLAEQHCGSEDARDALSKRPLSDYLYSVEKETATYSEKECKVARKKCRSLYRAAVSDIPTVRMWDFFLTFLLDWCKQRMSVKATTRVYEQLLKVMDEAAALNCLSPSMWCHRIEVSLRMGHSDSALMYSVNAVHDHSDSVELWVKCLQLLCTLKEDYSDVEELFLQAVDAITGKDSLQVWVMWCEYCQSACPDKVEAVFERAVEADKAVSDIMNSCYLKWKAQTAGMKQAKRTFERLAKHTPVPLTLYQTWIQLEKTQPRCHMKRLRSVYEKAIWDHGNQSADLWLDYVRAELVTEGGAPETVSDLHWRAMRALSAEDASIFVEQYALLTVQ